MLRHMARLRRLLDRERERELLEQAWRDALRGEPQFIAISGRRRVGKTFLLSHFARGKRALFFGATQQAEAVELGRLHEAVRRDLGARPAALAGGGFTSWEGALHFLFALAEEEPLLVVLDEVPYLTRSTRGFASIVQHAWDHRPAALRLLLVVSGSAISTMTALLGPRGPLRGRPTRTLEMEPFTAQAARAFLPRLDPAAFFEAYAACGGYPLHLERWDQSRSTQENLLALAGEAGTLLLEDAESMIREELASPSVHARVLATIGRGRTAHSEIAAEVGQRVQYSLELLERTGFIRRAVPLGAPRGARGRYELADPYLRFWFRLLASDVALIEAGQGAAVLRRKREEWQAQVGWTFEEAARDHARRLVAGGRLARDLVVGRWWLHRGRTSYEVDVLGLHGDRTALLGEARWQEQPLGMQAFLDLQRMLQVAPRPLDDMTFAFWSRGGVTPDVRRAGALSYTPAEMLRQQPT